MDYLLAKEREVCEKFNESDCCIEIGDYRETIKNLAAEIKKVAHVPVQKFYPPSFMVGSIVWRRSLVKKGGVFYDMFNSWITVFALLIPCFIRLIHSVVQSMQIAAMPVDRKLATGKLGQAPKLSRIMKLREGDGKSRAAEALARFESQVNEEKSNYGMYQVQSWDE